MALSRKKRVNALLKDLQEGDDYYREMAARRLGKLKDPRAVEALVEALDDGNTKIREAAAEALVDLGDNRAVEILQAELKDKSISVQRRAAFALISLKPDIETLGLLEKMEQDEAAQKLRLRLVTSADQTAVGIQERINDVVERIEQGHVDRDYERELHRCMDRMVEIRKIAKVTEDINLQEQISIAIKDLDLLFIGIEKKKRKEEEVATATASKSDTGDFMAEMEKLMAWKKQGMLTNEEFIAAKEKLLKN